ncbi:hypothetical protein HA050_05580 [Iodobacter sp. HSC-16F04]|uniref:DUF6630 domain-containing protein n=1 Tax=Iodobacter violaceini TaxID=3044271 RepID=A0ABX0KSA9_9NEIS|nr:hypothetical protein [Iodobacter violacea]NHQ85588.1 hypothetical protein [Iodobacter violacea]
MIQELLRLLSCNEFSANEIIEAAQYVENAPDNPELEWAGSAASAMTFAIYDKLYSWTVEGDKIDEIHEQLEDMFSDPLPAFPYDDIEIQNNSFAYFRWINCVLAGYAIKEGGYELLSIDPGTDDQLRLLIVYKKDTSRILELAQALSLRITREDGAEPYPAPIHP